MCSFRSRDTAASTEAARRRTISTIYGLGAALLLLGLVFGKRDATGTNRIPKPVRMLTSALVLACALLLRRGQQPARRGKQAGLIAAGMGSGFLGDLIMARVVPLPEHVLFGMLAFGAGHTCYIRAFLRQMSPGASMEGHGTIHEGTRRDTKMGFLFSTHDTTKVRWTALSAAWLIALLGWWALVRNPKIGPALNYGALAYALLLSSMSGLATALAYADRRYAPVATGGALFLASDMLLASELFRSTHFPQIGDVVWLTYISGQALIVAGMAENQNQEPRTENQ
jgi:uncharacterized membrane protein YhhN